MQMFIYSTLIVVALASGCSNQVTNSPQSSVLPNFTQTDQNGKTFSLTDFKGRVVLVEFWATWCGPCLAHTPLLRDYWNSKATANFTMIGISLDYDLNSWRNYIAKENLGWTHGSDGKYWDNSVARQFDIRYTPAFLVFNVEGLMVGSVTSFTVARSKVDSLLAL